MPSPAASTIPRRPKFFSGTVGGSLSFQCHHDPRGTYERKYLCRWEGGSCPVLLDDEGFVLESYKGRIQISSSDPERGTYAVVLRQLREEDAGWYWCGARSGHAELTASLKLLIHKGRWWQGLGDPQTIPGEAAALHFPSAISEQLR